MDSAANTTPTIIIDIRDYLSPGNRYQYTELAGHLATARASLREQGVKGLVYLRDVSGFMMVSSSHVHPGYPWYNHRDDTYHYTASDALRGIGGKDFEELPVPEELQDAAES